MATKIPQNPMPACRFYDFRREIDDALAKMRHRTDLQPFASNKPPFELTREGEEYVVRLDVPGSDPEEIEISLLNNTIRVRGARTDYHADNEHRILHSEIARGAFERVLELPEPLRPEEIKARYKHGVLEVRIRPVRKTPKRKIVIQTQ
jgi:HSP20 family protein